LSRATPRTTLRPWTQTAPEAAMKVLLFLPALAAVLAAAPTRAQPGGGPATRICIRDNDIRDTKITDDRTIVFHLRNGKTYVNTLVHRCAGLKFNGGFVYDGTPNGELCDNLVTIRVVHAGNACLLGAFTPGPDDTPDRD
jgi:hypothetical protein